MIKENDDNNTFFVSYSHAIKITTAVSFYLSNGEAIRWLTFFNVRQSSFFSARGGTLLIARFDTT